MTPATLAQIPTPLVSVERLGEWLGLRRLLMKRDDLTGLALGGNKARKLELLCGEACEQGSDVLVTGGGPQSNHARQTAAAASRIGLDCHLVLTGARPDRMTANLLLDQLFGATFTFTGDDTGYDDLEEAIEVAGAELARTCKPYVIPIGGASTVGVIAYLRAAGELSAQLGAAGYDGADHVVVADGSGGTHAGLVAGLPSATTVVGVDVGARPDLDHAVPRLAAQAAVAVGLPLPGGRIVVDHHHHGEGYGAPTEAALEALRVTARLEGVALDPVYTSKAMAALIAGAREGRFSRDDVVVFWHTGGAVGLFAERYATVLSEL